MGLLLGLLGGGGSILALPILLYLFNIAPRLATLYTLFIVGCTSLIGSISHLRKGNFETNTALRFGSASVLSVSITRLWVLPAIPEHIASLGSFEVTKTVALLLLFAVIMLVVSYKMIQNAPVVRLPDDGAKGALPILLRGFLVGLLTGLVGAGGGFLVVPALRVIR